eukprot:6492003-Amphidinium_carterae.1
MAARCHVPAQKDSQGGKLTIIKKTLNMLLEQCIRNTLPDSTLHVPQLDTSARGIRSIHLAVTFCTKDSRTSHDRNNAC